MLIKPQKSRSVAFVINILMNINDIDSFSLNDAISFHDRLNPKLFAHERLKEEVRKALLAIAEDFIEYLGVQNLHVMDITMSGSNAAYSYTNHSDIDLHILVDMTKISNDEIYQELFTAKKNLFNNDHSITVRGYDVEVYVQDSNKPVKSLGEYSIKHDKWIRLPVKRKAQIDQDIVQNKFKKLVQLSELALRSNDQDALSDLLWTIKKYRQAGLDKSGEFGPENLAYKALRSRGIIDKLYDHADHLKSKQLSLDEIQHDNIPEFVYHVTPTRNLERIRKFGLKAQIGSRSRQISEEKPGVYCFANKDDLENAMMNWLGDQFDDEQLSLLKIDTTGLNGQYTKNAEYEIVLQNVPPSRITVLTKDLDNYDMSILGECSGYIPSESEKNDPRWSRALSVDVHPDTMKKNAKKFGSNIARDGRPPVLKASGKF